MGWRTVPFLVAAAGRAAEYFLLSLWRAGARPSLGTGSAEGVGVVGPVPSSQRLHCLAPEWPAPTLGKILSDLSAESS